MRRIALFSVALSFACGAQASWYWPFESDGVDKSAPRISELMEPASELIDEASDLAADGKIDESVEKYRKALAELDRIELENPERAKSTEFATLRNKRAYVNAAIDSMLLSQVKQNAKAVAVSDTTELEAKLAEEKGLKVSKSQSSKVEKPSGSQAPKTTKPSKHLEPLKPLTKREQAIADIANGDYAAAEIFIKESLAAKPNNAMALNLKAAMEMKQGKFDEAEKTLDQAIVSNPRNPSAYYNLALLSLQKDGENKSVAKRYYETGRAMGGESDPQLEELFK
ncbi:MAG: tetratricopeptide repeat protein [bacterium]|nr:tetratricopeptide repeat protein [Candidatus Colisoma equi]